MSDYQRRHFYCFSSDNTSSRSGKNQMIKTKSQSKVTHARNARANRPGIVLLVVLGMLTLFSVLGVSYLVFTSRQRAAAISISRSESSEPDSDQLLGDALEELLVGSNGPDSSLWGHDLLGDLYGMRDGILGELTPETNFVVADDLVAPNVLLNEFVRIPTELFRNTIVPPTFPHRRTDDASLTERVYPASASPVFDADDELTGRILTFTDGPLEGLSMPIVRYFGDHLTPNPGPVNGRQILSGQVVLDMRAHLGRSVTVESVGETHTIAEWIDKAQLPTANTNHQYISVLFYNQAPESGTGAVPLSIFFVNGRILNGPGLGFDVARSSLSMVSTPVMNLNETINVQLGPHNPAPSAGSIMSGRDYDTATTHDDPMVSGADVPVPLQGNYALYRRTPVPVPGTPERGYLQDLPAGDTDEGYDAPDDQNWWLSYFPTDNRMGASSPSFVRPGTLHWLINQQTGALSGLPNLVKRQQILRAIQRACLRPLPISNDPSGMPSTSAVRADGVLKLDYQNFTGSNTSSGLNQPIDFATVPPGQLRQLVQAIAGADLNGDGNPDWDVDNNADGIPDSVWVDAGLPLTESPNGTLIKPLVAYLVEDLGGRVDVNLAGNLVQGRNVVQKSAQGVLYRAGTPTAATVTHNDLPAGFGYGPAEINIRSLFLGTTATGNGPLDLLRRRLGSVTYTGVEYVSPGHLVDPLTGTGAGIGNDFLGMLRQPSLPNLFGTINTYRYGLPVDKFGRSSIALGIDGGLMVSNASFAVQNGGAAAGDASDDPYEFDPSAGGSPDNAFTLADLEGMLRFRDYDRDALNSALVELADSSFTGNADRIELANSVTTLSSSVAATVGTLPQEWRGNTAASRQAGGIQALLTNPFQSTATVNRNDKLMQLIPQEVLAGGKLDLNRPFGNGIDDDGNGFVDDPAELRSQIQVFYRDLVGVPSNTFYSTPYTDITVGEPGPYSLAATNPFPEPSPQALFARHLYVMAMTLVRDQAGATAFNFAGATLPTIDGSNQTEREVSPGMFTPNGPEDEFRAWQLAQWAINVADFRDPDGIMSRFDYDVFPFDGWDIAATSGTPIVWGGSSKSYRTVWGMEFPELSLEESIAFHNRNVRDTNLDSDVGNEHKRFEAGSFEDDDMDQYRLPQGSLYLELRSTRSPDYLRAAANDTDNVAQAAAVPPELYSTVDIGGGNSEFMLDLGRTAPDRNPVWRIAVTPAHAGPSGDPTQSGDEMLRPVGSEFATPIGYTAATAGKRSVATMQPDLPDFFGPTIVPIANQVDRVIWFTNINPDNGLRRDGSTAGGTSAGQVYGDLTADDGFVDFAPIDSQNIQKIFYNRFVTADYPFQITVPDYLGDNLTEVHLRGGQHTIVGPRAVTYMGTLEVKGGTPNFDLMTEEPLVTYIDFESPQRFLLTSTSFEHRSLTDMRTTPTVAVGGPNQTIRSTLGIIAAANRPTGFTCPPVVGTTQAIGINVSEPLPDPTGAGYYASPTASLKAGFPFDSYRDYNAGMGVFPDEPFDVRGYAELFSVFGPEAERTGTRERFKTAYLQRLADPTQPHDEILNPYLSVDYITIDLTVFNGSDGNKEEMDAMAAPPTQWVDKNDPDPFGVFGTPAPFPSDLEEAFASRYKTGHTLFQDAIAAVTENLAHGVNTFAPQVTVPATGAALAGNVPYFPINLNIQASVHPDTGTATPPLASPTDNTPVRTVHSSTLGYANASYGSRWITAGAGDTQYAGTPTSNWFSAATWLNRPYVSPLELMWVPTTSAGRFNANFGTATADTNFTVGNIYDGTGAPVGGGERQEFNRVFPHLWNFFSSNPTDFTLSPNMHRILDFVDVPAPYDFENDFISTNSDAYTNAFVGTTTASVFGDRFDYQTLGGTTTTGDLSSWSTVATTTNQFWLNRYTIEAFRTPLNIRQPQYRQGKINLNTIKSPRVYRALMEGISSSTDPAEGAFFTTFLESRRGYVGAAGAEPVQQVGSTLDHFDPLHAGQFTGAFKPASAGDLSPIVSDRVRAFDRTLMRPVGATAAFGPEPLFQKPLGGGINGSFRERSVAHNELGVTRLSNLASNQSNAFAVWITVGLFKVSGELQVGEELGSDIGKNRRYRAFHIIDRSVPAMYEPGELNNALETVLLSRKLN